MDKEAALVAAKRRALLFLGVATVLFIGACLSPAAPWAPALKAVSEAAMVGGLADWFAVAALFHRIPTLIPQITDHTAIIPRSKDRIADNLAEFVRDKFLDADSLVSLIRKHDPASHIAEWLSRPALAEKIASQILKVVEGSLGLVEEASVKRVLKSAVEVVFAKVDMSASAGSVLEALTQGGRHHQLLEQTIEQVIEVLDKDGTREVIARTIVRWLRSEHPIKEKMLPTEWLGENGAKLIASGVTGVLDAVRKNPTHELRSSFDAQVSLLILRLKADPLFKAQGEKIKAFILDDPAFTGYLGGLWDALRNQLMNDIRSKNSVLHRHITASSIWLGRQIATDANLRSTLNVHFEQAARSMAPDFAVFLTSHIRDTIRNWDAKEMSRQIELSVGRDLQAIRINGTLVGGGIGLLLYAVGHATQWFPQLQSFIR